MAYIGDSINCGKCSREAFVKIAETLQRPVREYKEHFVTNTQETRWSFCTDNHEYVCNNVWLYIRPLTPNLRS